MGIFNEKLDSFGLYCLDLNQVIMTAIRNMLQNNGQIAIEFTTIPIFSALNEAQFHTVLSTATKIDLVAGGVLFQQGQHANHFYFVHDGQMRLSRLAEDGSEKVMDIVHPGQMFAEAVMFMPNRCYPVNAAAIQPSHLVAFDMETFRNILKESVDTCFRLMSTMSQRLHVQLNEIDSLSLHNATYRLAHYLLKSVPENSAGQTEFTLGYPKNILASRLSIQPETFSRIMARLKRENIVVVQGNQIVLHDIPALRKLLSE